MQTNSDLFKALRGAPRARFYLCDLHVHSPASADVRQGSRFGLLSKEEKELVEKIEKSASKKPAIYEEKALSVFPVSRYYDLLVAQRDEIALKESIPQGEDWAIVAITDHDVCTYSASLAKHAWQQRRKNRLMVLPGIELEVSFSVAGQPVDAHVILIYQPEINASDIRLAIHSLVVGNWQFGESAQVSSLPQFIEGLRNHKDYPAVAVAAHVASGKGIREEARRVHEQFAFTALDVAIARTSAEIEQDLGADKQDLESRLEQLRKEREHEAERVSLEVLRLIGSCGFDALQVSCKEDAIHYRRLHRFRDSFGRAVPVVVSDAHRVDDVFVCESNTPYLKLSIQSAMSSPKQLLQGLRHAIRYGETRFSYCTPGQVTRWISGLEITPDAAGASRFWPFDPSLNSFVLPLSRNLNCLVGGRGSGKSAAIEALAFVAEPAKFEGKSRKRDEDLKDWYKRARATMAGCQVRLVWQAMGSTADLPKGALFASRYFNPAGEHGAVGYTKLDGKEVLGSSLSLEPPQMFRARDIENAVEPKQLRHLFDGLVGPQIPEIESEIAGLLAKLSKQRAEMGDIAWRVMELTEDDTPLREYCRRKAAYQTANRPEVQPFYTKLDDTSAAHTIAKRTKKEWDKALEEADIEDTKSEFIRLLDSLQRKTKDESGDTKPYCESLAKLFENGTDGKSPRSRLKQAFDDLQSELKAVGQLLDIALKDTESRHKQAREALEKEGLPKGARDREAKKQDFEEAERSLAEYRELMKEWQKRLNARSDLFANLEAKSKERTQLRKETAKRLTERLERDLDPSVLTIAVKVHEVEDKSDFCDWLADNIGPSIPKLKNARLQAIVDKGVMPKDVRNALLGETADAASVFTVDRKRARDGKVEPELVAKILQECSGKVHWDPEHIGVTDQEEMDEEFIDELPKEIRDGLWTFPRNSSEPEGLIVDAVLALDEVVFDDRTQILLNDRPGEDGSTLRTIGQLSPGQRCSAILPILLLNGRSPLIIDQPEDNLDNRLIRQVIVNILASIKLRRQVILATHNPNLPVLGDVEQAIVLRAVEEKQTRLESTGDLDCPKTVGHLTEIMEGGREAFQYRQSIYQAHWAGPVAQDAP